MKIVKAFVVLLIVIGLGVYVYFGVYKTEEERKLQEEHERHLIRFDIDRINTFTLARPESSVVFERGIGRLWNISEPIKAEADGKPLFTLFNSLNQSDILVTVDEKPKDLEPYGLAGPEYYMSMEYDVGEPDTLFIGYETPDETMTFVRFASENRVLAITNQLTELMKRPVIRYRSRTILNVTDNDITSFEIFRTKDGKEDRIHMVYNDITWMMVHPWNLPADLSNMEELSKKISESNKKSLEKEQTDDLSEYGLDRPLAVVTVTLKYGMPDKMILIGNRLTDKGKRHLWYAKQFDNDLIFTLENSLVTLLNRTKTWFIDKQPMKFNRNIVNKIILETADNAITFIKDTEGNWSVVSPVDKNLEQETINSIFAISRFLLINDIKSFEPTPEVLEETGLDKPSSVITFLNNDNLLVKARYGKTFMTDKSNTYMSTSLSPIIYVTGSTINSSINQVLNSVFGN